VSSRLAALITPPLLCLATFVRAGEGTPNPTAAVRSYTAVSYPDCMYKTGVDSLHKRDIEGRAVICDGKNISQSLRLTKGEGSRRIGKLGEITSAWLGWVWIIENNFAVGTYRWEWIAGSSSHSDFVQVFQLRENRLVVTQQIHFDTHHGGKTAGATYDPGTETLEIRAVGYSGSEGRCCPSKLKIVKYAWRDNRFQKLSSRVIPIPES
jgi:hypothetical protein